MHSDDYEQQREMVSYRNEDMQIESVSQGSLHGVTGIGERFTICFAIIRIIVKGILKKKTITLDVRYAL